MPRSQALHGLRMCRRPRPKAPRSRWRYVVPVVALAAGGLFGVSAVTSNGTDLRPATRDLVQVVRSGDQRVKTKAAGVRRLQAEVDALSAQRAPGSSRLAQLQKQESSIAVAAGMTPVQGSAVTVTLDDSHRDLSTLPADTDPNWLLVHQQDVQGVVNALWQGGATAMTIMDQRIISTSAVRCVGNTLLLQGRVYSPPFVISAMGDQKKLRNALQKDPAVSDYRDYVPLVGLGYSVSDKDDAHFAAYAGSAQLRYATSPATPSSPTGAPTSSNTEAPK
ncbi:DUF881 domain-containing protein [Allobranchiibius sp. GilTou73]|uniref:DUF881 domain-containing protein n=1 Tax=Allobranchiibius sp. GilTou73 TaxID=2904523 RepID=UPI001F17C123|nr:DUF881 domain-containing protein [Allobranchiibius sp. GilTou73]UIJ35527.1 DUF881 domain-containing protein [Allobranchiibius sp. GilTou73]